MAEIPSLLVPRVSKTHATVERAPRAA
jgi:hypothetical protein